MVGKDGDKCLVIACLSTYHCSMEVDYSWLFNGTVIKEGRKSFILYITQPGSYQCVVKVNDKEDTTAAVDVVRVVGESNTRGSEKTHGKCLDTSI